MLYLICNFRSKIRLSKLQPHFPGDNELKHSIGWYMTEAIQHCSLSSLICPCLYKWSPDSMDPTQYICYIIIYCRFSTEFPELICIYTSVNCIIIGWGNDLLPIHYHNQSRFSGNWTLELYFTEMWIKRHYFFLSRKCIYRWHALYSAYSILFINHRIVT